MGFNLEAHVLVLPPDNTEVSMAVSAAVEVYQRTDGRSLSLPEQARLDQLRALTRDFMRVTTEWTMPGTPIEALSEEVVIPAPRTPDDTHFDLPPLIDETQLSPAQRSHLHALLLAQEPAYVDSSRPELQGPLWLWGRDASMTLTALHRRAEAGDKAVQQQVKDVLRVIRRKRMGVLLRSCTKGVVTAVPTPELAV